MTLPARIVRSMNVMPFAPSGADFDQLVNQLFNGTDTGASYPVDVREDGDHYYIDAELPGFNKDEIDITVEKNVLTLSAEHKAESNQQQGEYLVNERRRQSVTRSFRLPPTVDDGSASANLVNGVLTLTLKKREEIKPRKITVA